MNTKFLFIVLLCLNMMNVGVCQNSVCDELPKANGWVDRAERELRFYAGGGSGNSAPPPYPSPVFWLRADNGTTTTTDGASLINWFDRIGLNHASSSASYRRPKFEAKEANYNPGIYFDGNNDQMLVERPVKDDFTFVVVVEPNGNGTSGPYRLWWEGDGIFDGEGTGPDFGGLSLWNNKIAFGTTDGDHTLISNRPIYGGGVPHIAVATRLRWNGLKRLYVDGYSNGSGSGITGSLDAINQLSIGCLLSKEAGKFYKGLIYEIIVFNKMLSTNERMVVENDMALKYGLTLNRDYTTTHGTVFTRSGYNFDIAGIGRDDDYGLRQQIATSGNLKTTQGGSTIISTSDDFDEVNRYFRRPRLNDGQYLVWGRNSGNTTNWIDEGEQRKVNRDWKVVNTAAVGEVFFRINLSGFPLATGGKYCLLVDNDESMANGITERIDLEHITGDYYSCPVTFADGVSYFSIGFAATLDVELAEYDNVSCNGLSDGRLRVVGTGGDGTYTYSWNNGATTAEIDNLSSGDYTVEVESAGATATRVFHLYNPDQFSTTVDLIHNVCGDDDDGVVDLSVTPPDEYSINFNGTSGYMALNHSLMGTDALPEFSVGAWIKVAPNMGGASIVDYDANAFFSISVGGSTRTDNFVHFETHSGSDASNNTLVSTTSVRDNNWHHVMCVYNGVEKSIYIDGVLAGQTTTTPHNERAVGSAQRRFGFVGCNSQSSTFDGTRRGNYFMGSVAAIEFWNSALSLQEVEARMYSNEAAANLEILWTIDEGTGLVVHSDGAEEAQLRGGVTWSNESFYRDVLFRWSKPGDTFNAATEDINSLTIGTYRVVITDQQGCTQNLDASIVSEHADIMTNRIGVE